MILEDQTEAGIAALWLRINQLQDAHEGELAGLLSFYTLAALRKIKDQVKAGLPVDLDAFMQSHWRELRWIFDRSLTDTADTFGRHVLHDCNQDHHAPDWLLAAMGTTGLALTIGVASSRYASATTDAVRKILRMPEKPRLAAWASLTGAANDNRARSAAAVEVHAASQLATQAAGEFTGLVRKRMWMSRLDGRERPEHHQAHGQIVGMNELYLVGGERLRFPGDPRVSIGNWIRCRCATALILR